MLGEGGGDDVDVDAAGSQHVLHVGPVAPAIEESFEHSKVRAREKGDHVAREGLDRHPAERPFVEPRGVQEEVYGCVVPTEAILPVSLEPSGVASAPGDLLREGV